MKNRAIQLFAALAIPLSPFVAAQSDTSESIRMLEKQVESINRQLSELKAQNPAAAETSSSKTMRSSANDGALTFATDDGQFSWRIDGRVQVDAARYSGSDNQLSNGVEARRVRFGVKTKLWDDWKSEADFDFADNEVDVKDAWIAYTGFGGNSEIKIGNFKSPFSIEEVTSSRMITFMERALPNAFVLGRRLGVGYTQYGEQWRVSGSVFGQELGDVDDSENDEAWGYAARANYLPWKTDDGLFLVGASYASSEPNADDDDRYRVRARPETHVEGERLLNTGKVKSVEQADQYGIEAAFQSGPLIIQGEYINTELDRTDGEENASYDGWYTFASYMLTGEQRPYSASEAEFGTFTPSSSSGAWEIAVRVSSIDLNDEDAGVEGGEADQYTLGVNYYPNRNIRLMLNYSRVDHDENADGDGDFLGDDDYDILQARLQVLF